MNAWQQKLADLSNVLNNAQARDEQPNQNTTLQPDPITPTEVEQGRVYEYHPAIVKPPIKSFIEETALWAVGLGAIQAVAIKVPVPFLAPALKIFLFPTSLLVATIALLVYGIYAYNSNSLQRMTTALQAAIGFMFSLFVIAILL